MKDLKISNILPIALGFALGYVAYKMVAKMIGDQDEVEPMLSASGSFMKRPGVQKYPPTTCACRGVDGGVYNVFCAKGWCPDCCKAMRERDSKLVNP